MEDNLHEIAIQALGSGIVCVDGGLTCVELARSGCTDAVLEHLKNLSKIDHLNLGQTRVTDRIMEVLQAHPEIKELHIDGTQVGDEGLRFLPMAKSLECLVMGNDLPDGPSNVTNKGLAFVTGLASLKSLKISGTGVTAVGMKVIDKLPSLECLFMSAAQVSEESIESLKRAPSLREITLGDAEDTDPVFIHLQESLPSVAVMF